MLRLVLATCICVGVVPLGASAFEQTTEIPKPSVPATEAGGSTISPDALELTVPEAAESKETGATISLPGIGKIGTLPKFDFGLELLYGDEEGGVLGEEEPVAGSDVRIRGSVKHKF